MNFLDGVEFDSAWQRKTLGRLVDLEVAFLSLDDYIATKRASGRPKDLADLATLSEILGHDS